MSSRRVASWVYDVLNVFMEALEMEVGLLSRGNATWRFYNQDLEHIRPLAAHLDRDGRHIFRDLLTAHPELVEKISTHDALRAQLVKAATDAYRDALANDAIHKAVDDARRRFLEKVPGAIPTGSFAAEKHVDLVIERLINEIEELPSHNTDAEFWRAHGKEFSAFSIPSMPAVKQARAELLASDQAVLKWLEDFSYDLCRQYDIPAAPSSSVGY